MTSWEKGKPNAKGLLC